MSLCVKRVNSLESKLSPSLDFSDVFVDQLIKGITPLCLKFVFTSKQTLTK